MEVARVAGDLEFAANNRGSGVRQVHGVEGVGLAERDYIGHVAHVANGEDAFAATHVADLAYVLQGAVPASEHGHHRLCVLLEAPRTAGGSGDPEVSVVFGHSELVQEVSGYLAGGRVRGARGIANVELVDVGVPIVVPPAHSRVVCNLVWVHPGVGGHVEVLVA